MRNTDFALDTAVVGRAALSAHINAKLIGSLPLNKVTLLQAVNSGWQPNKRRLNERWTERCGNEPLLRWGMPFRICEWTNEAAKIHLADHTRSAGRYNLVDGYFTCTNIHKHAQTYINIDKQDVGERIGGLVSVLVVRVLMLSTVLPKYFLQ